MCASNDLPITFSLRATSNALLSSMQTVLYETLVKLTKILAPIIPHTADEIWGHIPHVEEESVHLTNMPNPVNIVS